MAVRKGGLGKGLDAIFMENATENSNSTVTLKISEIEPNRNQPRRDFKDESLTELADSIAQHGVLQPLLVRPLTNGGYQIVAGERRWRACRMAGVSEVPVIIRELSDSEMTELALIENLQREDLSPVEEALGYQTLMEHYHFTQEEVSKSVGKSRPAVTNAMRLLNLPAEVLAFVSSGELSAGHARTLLSFPNEEAMIEAAKLVIKQGISVRDLEKMAKKAAQNESSKPVGVSFQKRNPFFEEVELSLNEHLGRKVKVSNKTKNKGILEIEFYSEEDLSELARLLGGNE